MKNVISFIVAASFTTTAMAADMNISTDLSKSSGESLKTLNAQESILNNEKMKRLHRDMTASGISEAGMEARVQMMSPEGKAYHEALEEQEKKTAG